MVQYPVPLEEYARNKKEIKNRNQLKQFMCSCGSIRSLILIYSTITSI
jgi:hypothetical protein